MQVFFVTPGGRSIGLCVVKPPEGRRPVKPPLSYVVVTLRESLYHLRRVPTLYVPTTGATTFRTRSPPLGFARPTHDPVTGTPTTEAVREGPLVSSRSPRPTRSVSFRHVRVGRRGPFIRDESRRGPVGRGFDPVYYQTPRETTEETRHHLRLR